MHSITQRQPPALASCPSVVALRHRPPAPRRRARVQIKLIHASPMHPCDTYAPMRHLCAHATPMQYPCSAWYQVAALEASVCRDRNCGGLHPPSPSLSRSPPLPLPPLPSAGAPSSSSSSSPPSPRPTPSAAAPGSAGPPPPPLPPPPRITPVASASAGAWAGTGAGAHGQPPLGYNKPAEHPGERERGGRLGDGGSRGEHPEERGRGGRSGEGGSIKGEGEGGEVGGATQ